MDIIYRIYTENKLSPAGNSIPETLAGHRFEGCTIYPAVGYWQGAREDSIVIEVLGDELLLGSVHTFAHQLKRELDQEAVLVTSRPITADLI